MIRFLFTSACVLTAAAVYPQGWPFPAGPEFVVNAYTTGQQDAPAVAADGRGNFVVAWRSNGQDGSGNGIVARRFDRSGTPIGGDFIANSYTTGEQIHPTVAAGRDGAFLVAWSGDGAAGTRDVYARRFDRHGAALAAEFRVNGTYTNGFEGFPAAAIDGSGRAVIAWRSLGSIASARRFAADGSPLGPEFVVRSPAGGVQSGPGLAASAAGDFIVVWTERNGTTNTDVRGQLYDVAGNPVGGDFLVNEASAAAHGRFDPVVAMEPGGSFTVAWASVLVSYPVGSFEVVARRFTAQGTPVGGEFQVNTSTTGDQKSPAIATSGVGDFVVSWTTVSLPGSPDGVFGRRYDRSGAPRGGEFQVDMATVGVQTSYSRAVAADDDGNFVVAWKSHDGHFYGVFARRFGGLHPAALVVDPQVSTPTSDGNRVLEPGEGVDLWTGWLNSTSSHLAPVYGQPSDWQFPGTTGTVLFRSVYDLPPGSVGMCLANLPLGCLKASVGAPPVRPSLHWDGSFRETVGPTPDGISHRWTLHLGDSFADVLRTSAFYRFIETLLHHGVTGGCTGTAYCPLSPASREQMAVFVLAAAEGAGYAPPACVTPVFADVPAASPFCPWIEELARRGVVAGCGGGNYCPTEAVSREQTAVFVLRTKEPGVTPPPCGTPMFADVPASSPFCPWIEELARRGVLAGCGGGNYCPAAAVTREQMAVFIAATFRLQLYGP